MGACQLNFDAPPYFLFLSSYLKFTCEVEFNMLEIHKYA